MRDIDATGGPNPNSALMTAAGIACPEFRDIRWRDIDIAQEIMGYLAGILDNAGELSAAEHLRTLRSYPRDDNGEYPADAIGGDEE